MKLNNPAVVSANIERYPYILRWTKLYITLNILVYSMLNVVHSTTKNQIYWDKVPERGNIMANIIHKSKLLECLVYNNKFRTETITATQIGPEDLATWKTLIADLHKASYNVYEAQENHADTTALKSALFESVKTILSEIGDLSFTDMDGNVHTAPIVIDDEFKNVLGELCSKYAGKLGNDDHPTLQLCQSKLKNAQNLLRQYKSTNGVNPEAIAHLEDEIEELEEEKKSLLKTADMSKKKPSIASESSFRSNFERHIARVIEGQKAQSWEEYLNKKEEQRKARRANTKAKRNQSK